MLNKLFSVKSQKGVTMIEYALIAALAAAIAVGAFGLIGPALTTAFTNIAAHLSATP